METGDFFETLNHILDGIDSEFNYINEAKAEYYSEMMSNIDYYWFKSNKENKIILHKNAKSKSEYVSFGFFRYKYWKDVTKII